MSYAITKLVVSKGRTVSHEKEGEWIREHYELEIAIPDEHELSTARENALHLLDDWLGLAGVAKQPEKTTFKWNSQAIKWTQAEGSKGPYEKASAEETSVPPDFVALLEDLKAHGGKLQRNGWFYWRFDKATAPTVGRKKRK